MESDSKIFLIGGKRHGEQITSPHDVGNEYIRTRTREGHVFYRHFSYLIFETVQLSDLPQYMSKETVSDWFPVLEALRDKGFVEMWSSYYGRFIEVDSVEFSKGRSSYRIPLTSK